MLISKESIWHGMLVDQTSEFKESYTIGKILYAFQQLLVIYLSFYIERHIVIYHTQKSKVKTCVKQDCLWSGHKIQTTEL